MEITPALGGSAGSRRLPALSLTWAKARRDLAPYGLALAIGAALAGAGLLMGHYQTFFSADSGVKLLAATSILHHWTNAAIPYRFVAHDPGGRYVLPLTAWVHGHDFAGYSLIFEYITALSMLAFGAAGTVIPPVLGTVAILMAQVQLARMLDLGRGAKTALLWLTVLATPVVFYSLTLWEHTWGVGLFLLGFTFLFRATQTRKWCVPIGLAVGGLLCLSALMRREMVIPAALLLVATPLVLRSRPALIGSMAAALVLVLPLAAIVSFNPQPLALGLSHATPGRAGILTAGSGAAAPSHLVRLEWLTAGGFATALLVVATIILIGVRRWKPTFLPGALATSATIVGLAYIVQLLTHYTWANENPFAFCPLLVLGLWLPLLFDRSDARLKMYLLCWGLALAGALAIVLVAADYGGGQWGPRYLLFAFPLLLPLALKARQVLVALAKGAAHKRLVGYCFVTLATLSVAVQGIGVLAIVTGKQEWSQTAAVIARQPVRIVVSTGDPSVDSIASIYGQKTILWAASTADLRTLMHTIRVHKLGRVTFVCGPRTACPWNSFSGWSHNRITRSNFVRYATYQPHGW
jgi:hypothetical protein